jgi:hypothetical protein
MHRYDEMLILAGVEKETYWEKFKKLIKRRIRNPYFRFLVALCAVLTGQIYTLRDEYYE